MQNIIYAVIGIILTIATLAMVAPAINQAANGMNTRMLLTEVSAINNTARMWMATQSTNNNYEGITNAAINTLIPDLAITGTNLTSRANNAVRYSVAVVAATPARYVLTITGIATAADQATFVTALNAAFTTAPVAAVNNAGTITITLQ